MSSPEVCKASLIAFEKQFHTDVFKWIEWKMSSINTKDAEILDFSVDDCVFSQLLATHMKAKRLVTAVRGEPSELIDKSIEIKRINGLSNDNLPALNALGQYDIIIIKEITHEAEDMVLFLQKLKELLKSDDGRIFVLAHPKNPPPPIPDVAVPFWRKMAPNREEVILAAKTGGLGQVCYAASCPVKVSKQEWYNVLKTRCFPALRECKKCTDKEIRDFVNGIRMWVLFEEKILIFLVTPRPEQGDAMEKELEPSTRNPVSGGGMPRSQPAQTPELKLAGGSLPPSGPQPEGAPAAAPAESAPAASPGESTPAAPPTGSLPSSGPPPEATDVPNDHVPATIEKVPAQEPSENDPCPDGHNCPGSGRRPSSPPPAGAIAPLKKADEKAAGILAERVVARAQLKTQPSVAEDFPESEEEES